MAKLIEALHAAGVAAPWIVLITLVLILAHYGRDWVKTISGCILEHRRFELEQEMSREAILIAKAQRHPPQLALEAEQIPVLPSPEGIEVEPVGKRDVKS